jgi:two-component system chemotaxis sensor kinase CheA
MDVVKRNIERLGGQVSVESEVGKGTTFTLKVPLTIATSRALLVKVDGQIYAIPAPNIEAMLYLTPDEIASRGGRDVVLHRNSVVPVVRLGDLIGKNPNEGHPLFVWQALSTDKVRHELASTGLAIKTASKNGNGFANGTLKDNNRNSGAVVGLTLADPEAQTIIQNMQGIIKAPAAPRFNFERMPAVVVGSGDRRFCMLVDSLEDEVEIVVKSLSSLLRVPHVSSATILGDGRVIMILDVPNLISTARKITSATRKTYRRQSTDLQKKRILVVDDSITTRELEKSILEAAGYHVDTADDGVKALEVLAANHAYDLVVSDVEMPVMDGFELTIQMKNNPIFKALPVIIVSSLNSEDHKRRGISAGAQAYITKGDFNQNNLLNTIEYLTS